MAERGWTCLAHQEENWNDFGMGNQQERGARDGSSATSTNAIVVMRR